MILIHNAIMTIVMNIFIKFILFFNESMNQDSYQIITIIIQKLVM